VITLRERKKNRGQTKNAKVKCLLIGGGGPVGTAAIYLMKKLGWTVYVADPHRPPHQDFHKHHLDGTITHWAAEQYTLDHLRARLAAEQFDLVIDLTPTLDKRQSLLICDEVGVSLVNSTMVDYKDDIHIAAFNFLCERPIAKHRPHIVASGMNPGAVNAMAEEIIRKYEQPDAICYWEYDGTLPHDGVIPGPFTTWSQGESGDEICEDWTFEVIEEGTVLMHEDALSWHAQDFKNCGVPAGALNIPDDADPFLIGHEECIYMGWRHDTAVKFVYGFHPRNMRLMRASGYGWKPHVLVNEQQRPLVGRDIVGVACRYDDDDSWVGQYCELANSPYIPADTNATCILVAAGVIASGLHLTRTHVEPGVHLTHELPGWIKAFRSLVDVHSYSIDGNNVEFRKMRSPRLTPVAELTSRNHRKLNSVMPTVGAPTAAERRIHAINRRKRVRHESKFA
jgi:hypothetical protein